MAIIKRRFFREGTKQGKIRVVALIVNAYIAISFIVAIPQDLTAADRKHIFRFLKVALAFAEVAQEDKKSFAPTVVAFEWAIWNTYNAYKDTLLVEERETSQLKELLMSSHEPNEEILREIAAVEVYHPFIVTIWEEGIDSGWNSQISTVRTSHILEKAFWYERMPTIEEMLWASEQKIGDEFIVNGRRLDWQMVIGQDWIGGTYSMMKSLSESPEGQLPVVGVLLRESKNLDAVFFNWYHGDTQNVISRITVNAVSGDDFWPINIFQDNDWELFREMGHQTTEFGYQQRLITIEDDLSTGGYPAIRAYFSEHFEGEIMAYSLMHVVFVNRANHYFLVRSAPDVWDVRLRVFDYYLNTFFYMIP